MSEQILEEPKQAAVVVVPSKQAVKEMLAELKKLKMRKDDLMMPINPELEEIDEKVIQLTHEITLIVQDLQETVKTSDGAAVWKQMPRPREFYDAKALDAITDVHARALIDSCKKTTKQGEPKVVFEVY